MKYDDDDDSDDDDGSDNDGGDDDDIDDACTMVRELQNFILFSISQILRMMVMVML